MKITALFSLSLFIITMACSSAQRPDDNRHLESSAVSRCDPKSSPPDVCADQESIAEKTRDLKKNAAMYDSACDGKNFMACHMAGVIAYNGGDYEKARSYWDSGCKHSFAESCSTLGVLEFNQGHKESGLKLLRSGCKGGYQVACEALPSFVNAMEEESIEKENTLKEACEADAKTAGCWIVGGILAPGPFPGEMLVRCLSRYQKIHPTFQINGSCSSALAVFKGTRKSKNK